MMVSEETARRIADALERLVKRLEERPTNHQLTEAPCICNAAPGMRCPAPSGLPCMRGAIPQRAA